MVRRTTEDREKEDVCKRKRRWSDNEGKLTEVLDVPRSRLDSCVDGVETSLVPEEDAEHGDSDDDGCESLGLGPEDIRAKVGQRVKETEPSKRGLPTHHPMTFACVSPKTRRTMAAV